jgi:membrane-associated phospholipid phosphatase
LRPGEAISVAAFFCFVLLGWLRRIDRTRQRQIIALGLLGFAIVILSQALAIGFPRTAQVIGDWLPGALILIVYWQSGRFHRTPNPNLQAWLERFDRRWLGTLLGRWEKQWSSTGVLYLVHRRGVIDLYWSTVLTATYLCYLVIPFASSLPPRLIHHCTSSSPLSKVHSFNLFILRNASIQINTFPSAHVASTMACALVLLRFAPIGGAAFLVVSLSIAAAAVLGRYHYTPDVVLGGLLATAVARFTLGF